MAMRWRKDLQRMLLSMLSSKKGLFLAVVVCVVLMTSLLHSIGDMASYFVTLAHNDGGLDPSHAEHRALHVYSANHITGKLHQHQISEKGGAHPTNDGLANGRHVQEIEGLEGEPIDIVYTWVNGSDPVHQKLLKLFKPQPSAPPTASRTVNSTAAHGEAEPEEGDSATTNRFRENDELRYSLRSVEKFAPFVRHVYIVTSNQIPAWLNLSYDRVSIVTHEQIFPNKTHLPSFSSPAIESHLHRIPGLSKRFLYLNDDVMFGDDLHPDDFYTKSGGHKVFLAWAAPKCAPGCNDGWIADGYCDTACNVTACDFDGGDCTGSNVNTRRSRWGYSSSHGYGYTRGHGSKDVCRRGCPDSYLGDKFCDRACRSEECGNDSGDCGDELFTVVWGQNASSSCLGLVPNEHARRKAGHVDHAPANNYNEQYENVYVPEGKHSFWVSLKGLSEAAGINDADYDENPCVRTATLNPKLKALIFVLKPCKGFSFNVTATASMQVSHRKSHRTFRRTNRANIPKRPFSPLVMEWLIANTGMQSLQNVSESLIRAGARASARGSQFVNVTDMASSEHDQGRLAPISEWPESARVLAFETMGVETIAFKFTIHVPGSIRDVPAHANSTANSTKVSSKGSQSTSNPGYQQAAGPVAPAAHDAGSVPGPMAPSPAQPLKGMGPRGRKAQSRRKHSGRSSLHRARRAAAGRSTLGYTLDFEVSREPSPPFLRMGEMGTGMEYQDQPCDPESAWKPGVRDTCGWSGLSAWALKTERTSLNDVFSGHAAPFDGIVASQSELYIRHKTPWGRQLLDMYGDSISAVSRVLNRKFGSVQRKVPAHMPHLIDKDIMQRLQDDFPMEFERTSAARFRQPDDMQYAFAFFWYLIQDRKNETITSMCEREFDTDGNGVLSLNEQRTVSAAVHVPISKRQWMKHRLELLQCAVKQMPTKGGLAVLGNLSQEAEAHWNAVTKDGDVNVLEIAKLEASKAPPGAGFTAGEDGLPDIPLPTCATLLNCSSISASLAKRARERKRYRHEVKSLSDVAFLMVKTNNTNTQKGLDSIRAKRNKFICLNDDMDPEDHETFFMLHDFYQSMFPIPSKFELENGQVNEFLRTDEFERHHNHAQASKRMQRRAVQRKWLTNFALVMALVSVIGAIYYAFAFTHLGPAVLGLLSTGARRRDRRQRHMSYAQSLQDV